MANDFLKSLIKSTGNKYGTIVSDGILGDTFGYIDTGSYSLNALVSGSIFGGLQTGKITAIGSPSGNGKTYFALEVVKNFLNKDKNNVVVYFESESALTKKMISSRGIDIKRMSVVPVATVEEFRHQASKLLDCYISSAKVKDLPNLFIVLDSMGALSTSKETEDVSSGSEKRDMTRAQLIKGAFRVLTLKLSKSGATLLVTNHVYSDIGGMYPQDIMSGGKGIVYSSDLILSLSKRKDKNTSNKISGNIISVTVKKGRLVKENSKIECKLSYENGLDRYFGLLPILEVGGIFKKSGNRYVVSDGTLHFGNEIYKNPDKYFTTEVLEKLDEVCKLEFLYGDFSQ